LGSCASKEVVKENKQPESAKAREIEKTKSDAPAPTPAAPVTTPPPAEKETKPTPEENGEEDSEDEISLNEGLENFYEMGDEIGRGGFSVVYEARNKKTGQKVAIKDIQLACQADEEQMNALKREIRIMKKVTHPNILKLYEVFRDGDDDKPNFYMVMEYVPGKELFERIIDRGQYSERHASNIIRQIVSALDYLHSNGIAHRDLKPENLMSSGDDDNEVIKIIDFGLSKKFGDEQLVTSVGSPGYVAPEVLTETSYDKSVDMWSVGVILYILLCGFPPFFADTSTELFKKIIDVKYDFDDPAWDDVSEAPKEIIRKLLIKDPKQRLTANQLADHPWVKGIGVGEKQLNMSNMKNIK